MAEKKLFREKAMEKLASPEQLDITVRLIPAAGWISLLVLGLLTLIIVLWGFLGSINYPEYGTGVFIKGSRVYGIFSQGTGTVNGINVKVGDYVQYGQIVGRVDQPQLVRDILEIKNNIALLKKEYDEIKVMDAKYLKMVEEYYAAQNKSSRQQEVELEQIFQWYQEFLKNAESVKDRGLISDISFQEQKENYVSLMNNLSAMKNNQLNYDVQAINTVFGQRKDHFLKIEGIKQQLFRAGTQLAELLSESLIISYASGYVQEILADQGDSIQVNERVMTLGTEDSEPLKAVLYFSALNGKTVNYGMEAQVTPTFLKAEDYGSIKGLVMHTSPYPVSQDELDETFQNPSLTKLILNATGGSPYRVEIGLLTTPNTYSGYRWTSSKGPPLKIRQGALATGSVITRTEKPANLVVEFFKRYFLGVGQREFELEQQL